MSDRPSSIVITTILFWIGAVASGLAAVALVIAARQLIQVRAPQRAQAIIVSSTGVLLICLKWLVPGDDVALQWLSYVGTGLFILGGVWQRLVHERERRRRAAA